jgi:hypothetical protein
LEIPKAAALNVIPIAAAAYWMLRPEDHQKWSAAFGPLPENNNGNHQQDDGTTL